ncbi:hypothetical protein [Sulfurovum sp.]|uniref:hypothetical protein n=1 Tax=Sulfurovum sp. TaxID=1969726 RepID=UPI002867CB8B|nr:hypothetical protein [Sulfurovum sp.]
MLSRILQSLLLYLVTVLPLWAVDAKVRVFVPKNETIFTSQKRTVAVEILSNAFSITDAKITFPASNKYIIQAPQSASYLGKEEVDSEDWQMVHYDYELYALQAGIIKIPSVLISFTASMGYGQPKKEFALKSDGFSFEVKSPKGVKDNQFVLVTDNFVLESKVQPQKKQIIVGDAVELSITQRANGIPDILFSPVVYSANSFMRVYPKEPELQSGMKGKYDVSRTDSFTFVASVEGNVTLPSQERVWYNSVTEKLHIEKVPEMTFEILPDPQVAIDAKHAKQKQLLLYLGVILVLLVLSYILFASKIKACRLERKMAHENSEEGIFEHLQKTIQVGDLRDIDKEYTQWLLSISPELSRGGMHGVVALEPTLSESLNQLNTAMVKDEQTFEREAFREGLERLRTKLLTKEYEDKKGLPQWINPQ